MVVMKSDQPLIPSSFGIPTTIPPRARFQESIVPCLIVPVWYVNKADYLPQPPLPLNNPSSEWHANSIVYRKSAFCEAVVARQRCCVIDFVGIIEKSKYDNINQSHFGLEPHYDLLD